jgi:hypothetical protein
MKQNKSTNLVVLLLLGLAICCFAGCGRVTKISGTVKFSDGEPIDFGYVVFDNGHNSYVGTIKKDGTYITGGVKKVEGIPDGVYKIWLTSTEKRTEEVYDDNKNLISYTDVPRVAEKYCLAEKTDLTFEVKKGGTKIYNIVVERP